MVNFILAHDSTHLLHKYTHSVVVMSALAEWFLKWIHHFFLYAKLL